jgi:DNA-binding transcriptional LysR family regulator
MDLKDIDLNLLVVFQRLVIERRVSAAAASLGLTQPAVSNALKRLRLLLDDELFIRTARGMEPTPYAAQLAEPIAYALNAIHSSLSQRSTFDPATSTRKFTISMTDLGEIDLMPRLMDRLATEAPFVTLSTVRNTLDHLADAMEAGQVDVAVGLIPQLKTGFFQRRLFLQRYVCMFRAGHEVDGKKLTAKRFFDADHVVVVSQGTGHARMDEIIESKGTRRALLTVPHFVAVGHILSTTNMLATVPERYALRSAGPFGLKHVPHPLPLPPIGINLFWHAKFHKDPANQWLRNIVFESFVG